MATCSPDRDGDAVFKRVLDLSKYRPATDGESIANAPPAGPPDVSTSGEAEHDVASWPDAWLLSAVRCEPPDMRALDALVKRYWKSLHLRCQVLALNGDEASDLAQETWARVLRARRTLQPDGNFGGYIATIATNICRDMHRMKCRSGLLASHLLLPLDRAIQTSAGDRVVIADVVGDGRAPAHEEAIALRIDMDRALERLEPRLRDVLLSRCVDGESAASIGLRYGRSAQTVTSWVRQASREMRYHLADVPLAAA
jgi:RNA polymerase sigma-70 factor (ECF subfamily)